jgi:hypothetical protein
VYLTDNYLSVQDGVLISFANMQNVTYDAEKDTIRLQPGVLWKDAIAALEPYGVAPLGGRVGLVTMSYPLYFLRTNSDLYFYLSVMSARACFSVAVSIIFLRNMGSPPIYSGSSMWCSLPANW